MDFLQRDNALTVSQVNTFIGQLLESNDILTDIHIRGEISNFKRHPSGHLYFSLKDADSVLRCVMFRSSATWLKFIPEDGMKVTARGRIGVYTQGGQYQLYVQSMEPDGIGALYIAFEQLKNKLAQEGLFDKARKRPIPALPMSVGLITSPSGAAVQDLLNILSRRFPLAEVILYPALVQGDGAPLTLIRGIRYFATHKPDVIIIGRGGGSIEDLWCFNDEGLAREIAACDVPVISAVGHETDYTICDFVADLRAPTPSAAAELAVPDAKGILEYLYNMQLRAKQTLHGKFTVAKQKLNHYASHALLRDPIRILAPHVQRLDVCRENLSHAVRAVVDERSHRIALLAEKLHALSPLAVLARGYAIVSSKDGKPILSVGDTEAGKTISVRLHDGSIQATVDMKKEENISNE